MAGTKLHERSWRAWALAKRQHGIVTRRQLLELGLGRKAVAHRLAKGRLHRVHRGVYAVGWPEPTELGRWMAAVLACGPGARLSHRSAAALWGIAEAPAGPVDVTVPKDRFVRRPGIRVHRRGGGAPVTWRRGIPATSALKTLVDLATCVEAAALERAINEADKLGLADPDEVRSFAAGCSGLAGTPALRRVLDRRTFALTDSELERRFLPLARRAGLPMPLTGRRVNGFKVDFHWPGLRLVVETDGLRYHRTPAQQARDRRRDQVHTAAGLTPLRFTHAQVRYEPAEVVATLAAVAARLRTAFAASDPS